MAIVIKCNLHPFGWAAKPTDIATITIHTTDDLQNHCFAVSLAGSGKSIRLMRPKSMSAHRNILHVLRDFLNDADLDALGVDYATTEVDKSVRGDDILKFMTSGVPDRDLVDAKPLRTRR